jgi:uncharacterized membrane protein (UPF0182 family)
MKSWKTKLLVAAAALVGLVIAVGLLKLIFVDFVVDFWWFQSQGMTGYFVIRLIYRYLVFAFFAAIFFAFFYVNFWFASRVVGVDETSPDKNNKNLVKTLHNGLRRMYLPLSIMMALPIAVPMYLSWEKALLFLFGGASGATDPLIGKDISFYLFSLPVYTLIQKEVLVAFIILLVGVVFLYWYESRLLAIHDRALPRRARVHVSALALATVAIVCWGFLLERYQLLYESVNLPIFFGPGYVEMKIILPMIWLTVFFLAATGISVVVSVNRKAGWKVPLVFGLLFLVCVLGKNADFFNDMVRKYIVAPNQIARERPYIDANIRSTLAAFGLDAVQTQDFKTQSKPAFDADDPALVRRLQNIPVWDREMLGGVYEELQGIRTYYSFPTIDVDRYTVEGSYRQVYLGAREIQFSKLPESAQNWINLHLQYTHGQGSGDDSGRPGRRRVHDLVHQGYPAPRPTMGYPALARRSTTDSRTNPTRSYPTIPGRSDPRWVTTRPSSITTATAASLSTPYGASLLFAMHFKDRNIFFTAKTNDRSRLALPPQHPGSNHPHHPIS